MDNLTVEKLEALGLQHNEALIYLALLGLGKGTVGQISKAAHLNRTTGYDILERLSLYGIANRSVVNKKKIYVAESPTRLKNYLISKRNIADKNLEKAEEILPDLQSLYKTDLKPSIKFFEGLAGIENIYQHSLEAKGIIYSILDLEQYLPDMDEFGKEHAKARTKLKVRERVLVRKSDQAIEFYNTTYKGAPDKQKITEYRWLEHEFPFSPAAEIMIYDDIVIGVLFKPGEKAAFEIQSQSFANSLKAIFELVWDRAPKVSQREKY
ncbi:TrmB family transcriptional regulator [Candidatus Kuenenbacteria bacterium]|nr:TrmB family transcriptional regulator [Candidatus Kuenenbacteria bacterium]